MNRAERIIAALEGVHERLSLAETQLEGLHGIQRTLDDLVKICIETKELAVENRGRLIDNASRQGARLNKQEQEIIEANARLTRLERQHGEGNGTADRG